MEDTGKKSEGEEILKNFFTSFAFPRPFCFSVLHFHFPNFAFCFPFLSLLHFSPSHFFNYFFPPVPRR